MSGGKIHWWRYVAYIVYSLCIVLAAEYLPLCNKILNKEILIIFLLVIPLVIHAFANNLVSEIAFGENFSLKLRKASMSSVDALSIENSLEDIDLIKQVTTSEKVTELKKEIQNEMGQDEQDIDKFLLDRPDLSNIVIEAIRTDLENKSFSNDKPIALTIRLGQKYNEAICLYYPAIIHEKYDLHFVLFCSLENEVKFYTSGETMIKLLANDEHRKKIADSIKNNDEDLLSKYTGMLQPAKTSDNYIDLLRSMKTQRMDELVVVYQNDSPQSNQLVGMIDRATVVSNMLINLSE